MVEEENGVRTCRACGMPVKGAEKAIYDGAQWYCGVRCRSQWIAIKDNEATA